MKFDLNRLEINYNNKNELVIKKTIWSQIPALWKILLVFIVGYFIITKTDNLGITEIIIISVIALGILFSSYKSIKAVISKEQFSFDLNSQTFYHNQIPKTSFSKIDFVEIINFSGGSEGSDSYLLNLRLKDKSSIQIDDSKNEKEIYRVAGEIASFINIELRKK